MYSRYILKKLTFWADKIGLPGREQISFHPGASTIDRIFTLSFLVSKYSELHGPNLFSAFIDLRGAFDSIDRSILWRKLVKWEIDPCLFFLIQQLHSSNTCRIHLDCSGTLTDNIPVNKGVRQGCILTSFLFNLYLADLLSFLPQESLLP